MTDYISRCAGLRPLITREQLSEIFPKDLWGEHRGGGIFGVQYNWGPSANNVPDGIGCENIVESVSFEPPFPADTPIYGFAIGTPRAEAENEMARLGLTALEPTGPEYCYVTGTLV